LGPKFCWGDNCCPTKLKEAAVEVASAEHLEALILSYLETLGHL